MEKRINLYAAVNGNRNAIRGEREILPYDKIRSGSVGGVLAQV